MPVRTVAPLVVPHSRFERCLAAFELGRGMRLILRKPAAEAEASAAEVAKAEPTGGGAASADQALLHGKIVAPVRQPATATRGRRRTPARAWQVPVAAAKPEGDADATVKTAEAAPEFGRQPSCAGGAAPGPPVRADSAATAAPDLPAGASRPSPESAAEGRTRRCSESRIQSHADRDTVAAGAFFEAVAPSGGGGELEGGRSTRRMRRASAFGTVAELTLADFELRVLRSHLQQLALLFVPHLPGLREGDGNRGGVCWASTTAGARECMEALWAHLHAAFQLID